MDSLRPRRVDPDPESVFRPPNIVTPSRMSGGVAAGLETPLPRHRGMSSSSERSGARSTNVNPSSAQSSQRRKRWLIFGACFIFIVSVILGVIFGVIAVQFNRALAKETDTARSGGEIVRPEPLSNESFHDTSPSIPSTTDVENILSISTTLPEEASTSELTSIITSTKVLSSTNNAYKDAFEMSTLPPTTDDESDKTASTPTMLTRPDKHLLRKATEERFTTLQATPTSTMLKEMQGTTKSRLSSSKTEPTTPQQRKTDTPFVGVLPRSGGEEDLLESTSTTTAESTQSLFVTVQEPEGKLSSTGRIDEILEARPGSLSTDHASEFERTTSVERTTYNVQPTVEVVTANDATENSVNIVRLLIAREQTSTENARVDASLPRESDDRDSTSPLVSLITSDNNVENTNGFITVELENVLLTTAAFISEESSHSESNDITGEDKLNHNDPILVPDEAQASARLPDLTEPSPVDGSTTDFTRSITKLHESSTENSVGVESSFPESNITPEDVSVRHAIPKLIVNETQGTPKHTDLTESMQLTLVEDFATESVTTDSFQSAPTEEFTTQSVISFTKKSEESSSNSAITEETGLPESSSIEDNVKPQEVVPVFAFKENELFSPHPNVTESFQPHPVNEFSSEPFTHLNLSSEETPAGTTQSITSGMVTSPFIEETAETTESNQTEEIQLRVLPSRRTSSKSPNETNAHTKVTESETAPTTISPFAHVKNVNEHTVTLEAVILKESEVTQSKPSAAENIETTTSMTTENQLENTNPSWHAPTTEANTETNSLDVPTDKSLPVGWRKKWNNTVSPRNPTTNSSTTSEKPIVRSTSQDFAQQTNFVETLKTTEASSRGIQDLNGSPNTVPTTESFTQTATGDVQLRHGLSLVETEGSTKASHSTLFEETQNLTTFHRVSSSQSQDLTTTIRLISFAETQHLDIAASSISFHETQNFTLTSLQATSPESTTVNFVGRTELATETPMIETDQAQLEGVTEPIDARIARDPALEESDSSTESPLSQDISTLSSVYPTEQLESRIMTTTTLSEETKDALPAATDSLQSSSAVSLITAGATIARSHPDEDLDKEFQCTDGSKVIPGQQVCDSLVQCADVSDELNCTCKQRIAPSKICDGIFDCPTLEDERGCRGCTDKQFNCDDNRRTCLTMDKRCDAFKDCPDGRDEHGCDVLSPSVEPPIVYTAMFSSGVLVHNYKGAWYPVCANSQYIKKYLHQVCVALVGQTIEEARSGLITVDPAIYQGPFVQVVRDGNTETAAFNVTKTCEQVYHVICPIPHCGRKAEDPFNIGRRDFLRSKSTTPHLIKISMPTILTTPSTIENQQPRNLDTSITTPSPLRSLPINRYDKRERSKSLEKRLYSLSRKRLGPTTSTTTLPNPTAAKEEEALNWTARMQLIHQSDVQLTLHVSPPESPWTRSAFRPRRLKRSVHYEHLIKEGQTYYEEMQKCRLQPCSPQNIAPDTIMDYGRPNRVTPNSTHNGNEVNRIVGGVKSTLGAAPWTAAVYRNGNYVCGATVISSRWIITAGHCTNRFYLYYYEVQVSMLRRYSFSHFEQTRLVTEVHQNPDYNPLKLESDIALLLVKEPFHLNQWATPACLPPPTYQPEAGTLCTMTGWGNTAEGGTDPDQMQEVQIPVWADCIQRADPKKEFCAGWVEGGKDACQGDSGGPLMCPDPEYNGVWVLAGIISRGKGCARANEPGVYSRVTAHLDWIYATMSEERKAVSFPITECPGIVCKLSGGACVFPKFICDRIVDCLDAEDELNCNYNVTFASNRTSEPTTSTPAPKIAVDHVHEIATQGSCKAGEFQCKKVQQCIPRSNVCNAKRDCADATDEQFCSCVDLLRKTNATKICDSMLDCADMSDEANCVKCSEEQFYCRHSRKCIEHEKVCDNNNDCIYGEDEKRCIALAHKGKLVMQATGQIKKSHTGLVAVNKLGFWQPLCVPTWTMALSNAVCKYSGYQSAYNFSLQVGVLNALSLENPSRLFWIAPPNTSARNAKKKTLDARKTYNNFQVAASVEDVLTHLKSAQQFEDPLNKFLKNHMVNKRQVGCYNIHVSCNKMACGIRPSYGTNANQLQAGEGLWPWQGSLYADGKYLCGATLISVQWVLISQHCLAKVTLGETRLAVLLGAWLSLDMASPFEQIRIVISHVQLPDTNMALLQLQDPVDLTDNVNPLCLSPSSLQLTDYTQCVTLGKQGNVLVGGITHRIVEACSTSQHVCTKSNSPTATAEACRDGTWSGVLACNRDNVWYATGVYHSHSLCFINEKLYNMHESLVPYSDLIKSITNCNATQNCPPSWDLSKPNCHHVCALGNCLTSQEVCNGILNCREGSDEPRSCTPSMRRCKVNDDGVCDQCPSDNEFACNNTLCVSAALVCNGVDDCGDNSDEETGSAECFCQYLNKDDNRLCDGVLDCPDGREEKDCKCDTDSFRCYKSDHSCIERTLLCDGRADCPLEEDESNCVTLTTKVPVVENVLGLATPEQEGFLMPRLRGSWFTYCDVDWDHEQSDVICKELGFNSYRNDNQTVPPRWPFYDPPACEKVVYVQCA